MTHQINRCLRTGRGQSMPVYGKNELDYRILTLAFYSPGCSVSGTFDTSWNSPLAFPVLPGPQSSGLVLQSHLSTKCSAAATRLTMLWHLPFRKWSISRKWNLEITLITASKWPLSPSSYVCQPLLPFHLFISSSHLPSLWHPHGLIFLSCLLSCGQSWITESLNIVPSLTWPFSAPT